MKQILLKRKKLYYPQVFALVDDEDYEFLSKFTWYCYRYTNTTYVKGFINGVCKGMHTVILKPATKDITVDHIDGNGLNNQKSNLRLATLQQQRQNKSQHSDAISPYKGVYYRKDRGYYAAQICINGKQTNLGSYKSEIEAAKAYNRAATKYFGEFAKLNTSLEVERGSEIHGATN